MPSYPDVPAGPSLELVRALFCEVDDALIFSEVLEGRCEQTSSPSTGFAGRRVGETRFFRVEGRAYIGNGDDWGVGGAAGERAGCGGGRA